MPRAKNSHVGASDNFGIRWVDHAIASVPIQDKRESWWTKHAASADRAAFDKDIAEKQPYIRTGKFGVLQSTHNKFTSEV